MTPKDYFNSYQYLAEKTIYKIFPEPYGVCKQHRIELSDLMQMAAEGLWKGCLSYKSEKGTNITTHLINNIRWNICEKLKREGFIKYNYNKYDSIEKFRLLSIDAEIKNENGTLPDTYHEIIPDETINIENDVLGELSVEHILTKLTDKQKELVKLKLKGLNSNDIGKIYKTTSSNIRWHLKNLQRDIKSINSTGEPFQKQDNRKKGRKVYIEGKLFDRLKDAQKEINLCHNAIIRRLRSDKFKEWYYVS